MPTAIQKSTSVRTLSASLGLLERAAPRLGARVVERIWFTVPARRRPVAEPPPGGIRFEIPVDGRVVRGRHWGHGDAAVYLVHGWGGEGRQLSAFISPLLEAGFSVVTYDALSHGDSDPGPSGPRRSTALEQVAALRAVVARHGSAYGVVAHSLGSMVTAVAMRDGIVPQRAVYVAPMADATSYTEMFTRMLGGGQRTWGAFITRLERRFGLTLAHFDILAMAGEMATPRLLVVHDREDRETRWEASRALVRGWPDARLMTTVGLGHNRILRAPEVVNASVDFLVSGGAPAPWAEAELTMAELTMV